MRGRPLHRYPRVCWLEWKLPNGKLISRMGGVAFNIHQHEMLRQKAIRYRGPWWFRNKIEFKSEEL